jgi:hypothetical protein
LTPRHALALHAWLTSPDFDEEGDLQRAEAALAGFSNLTPLLAAAFGAHDRGAGTAAGGVDPALEATPSASCPCAPDWRARCARTRPGRSKPGFRYFSALADEAEDGLQLLAEMERIWFAEASSDTASRLNSSVNDCRVVVFVVIDPPRPFQ